MVTVLHDRRLYRAAGGDDRCGQRHALPHSARDGRLRVFVATRAEGAADRSVVGENDRLPLVQVGGAPGQFT